MREIATLQLGTYANYVGAHFWNFQVRCLIGSVSMSRPRPSGVLFSYRGIVVFREKGYQTRHTGTRCDGHTSNVWLLPLAHCAAPLHCADEPARNDELLGLASDMDSDPVFQQSGLDMDVLYRAGETRQGVATYTPRLLAVDMRGSLGAVRPSDSSYNQAPEPSTASVKSWSGRISTHIAECPRKNEFLRRLDAEEKGNTTEANDETVVSSLENEVHSWTDYLKAHLHPRSVYEMEGIWSGVTPFEEFGCGKGLLSEAIREDLLDKFRLVVEECDHLQGIQTIVDDSGGFAGIASDALVDLMDSYGGMSMMLFTVRAPSASRSLGRCLHDAVSFASLSSFGDIVVPVGLSQLATSNFSRHLSIQDAKHFHTSAVYAAALHSATAPFRMGTFPQAGACDMGTLTRNLSYSGRRITRLDAAFPAPQLSEQGSEQSLNLCALTPDTEEASTDFHALQSLAIHGARIDGVAGSATVSKVLNLVSSGKGRLPAHVAFSPCPLPVPLPFPCIFGPSVGRYGDITAACASAPGRGGLDVLSVPSATRLSTDKGILPYIKRRQCDLELLGLKRGSPGLSLLSDWGLSREEIDELREALADLSATLS